MSTKRPKSTDKRIKELEEQVANFTVEVKKTAPGKVSSAFITIDNYDYTAPVPGTAKAERNEKAAIAKSSKQQDIANPNTLYISPTINPAVCYQLFTQDAYHARACRFIAHCVAGTGYNIIPVDDSNKNFDKDPEFIKTKEFCARVNQRGERLTNVTVNASLEKQIYGYSFLECVPNLGGELAEIYNLRAINTFAKIYYDKLYYVQRIRGKDIFFKPLGSDYNHALSLDVNEVLMLQTYNPQTKYYGLPPWYSATGDLVLSRKIIEYRLKRFDNNLFIQFIIICEGGELDKTAIEDIKKFMSSNFKGSSNAGKVLYLNSNHPDVKIRIERIDSDLAESGFIQTRDQAVSNIAAAHGVAPILMGAMVKGSLGVTTAIKDLFTIFNETICKPEKEYLEDQLNYLLKLRLNITKFKIELKELTIDTLAEIVKYIQVLYPMGLITPDEARSDLGFKEPLVPDTPEVKLEKIAAELKEIKKQMLK